MNHAQLIGDLCILVRDLTNLEMSELMTHRLCLQRRLLRLPSLICCANNSTEAVRMNIESQIISKDVCLRVFGKGGF